MGNPFLRDTAIYDSLMQFAATVFTHHACAYHLRIHRVATEYLLHSVGVYLLITYAEAAGVPLHVCISNCLCILCGV